MSFSVRWLLLALPVAMVAFVTLALVTGGTARPYRVARVWGGPTDSRHVSLRVEAVEVVAERAAVQEVPLQKGSVSVELHAPGFDARRTAALDREGSVDLAFELPSVLSNLEITVSQGEVLARGPLALDAALWARAARRRGGWAVAHAGALEVRLSPLRGALAVPFEEPLAVVVLRAGEPREGVRVYASGSGGSITPELGYTDAQGKASLLSRPSEHVAQLSLRLEDGATTEEAVFVLPVVPGALEAHREGQQLRITSPVPRDVAYYAFVTEHERLLGGRAQLVPNPSGGGASALIPYPSLEPRPEYVVVSSERDLRSPAAVGWPLDEPDVKAEPRLTFDAVDALLVNGGPRAAVREARRAGRVRWVVGAVCAATLALELFLLMAFTRRSDRSLDAHLEGAGVSTEEAERLAPKRTPRVVIALIVISLGFFIVAALGVLMAR